MDPHRTAKWTIIGPLNCPSGGAHPIGIALFLPYGNNGFQISDHHLNLVGLILAKYDRQEVQSRRTAITCKAGFPSFLAVPEVAFVAAAACLAIHVFLVAFHARVFLTKGAH